MSIVAKVSATEVTNIITDRYVDQYFEARLFNSQAFDYDPNQSSDDATLLNAEIPIGQNGYERVILSWGSGEVGGYSDGGVALAQKAAVFSHDPGAAGNITFSHIGLVWSGGNVTGLGSVSAAPSSATNTTADFTNIPIDSTNGSGRGLTIDLEITGNGAGTTNYIVKINKPGYGYAAGNTLTIANATLKNLDASMATNSDLVFSVGSIYTPTIATTNDLFTVVKTASPVNLTDGNQAAFYWNIKQFGFYRRTL